MTGDEDLRSKVDMLLRVQAGEDELMQELVRKLEPLVQFIVRARMGERLKQREEPEDVAQNVLMDIERDLPKADIETPGQLAMWLAAVVRHQILGRVKHHAAQKRDARLEVALQQSRDRLSSSDFRVELEAFGPTASGVMRETELEEGTRECLEAMERDEREVLLYRMFAGYTLERTAEAMKRDTAMSVSRLHKKAALKLVSCLRRRGFLGTNDVLGLDGC